MSKIVEIYGANSRNKGGELMLAAAIDGVRPAGVAVPLGALGRADRSRHDVMTLLEHPREKANTALLRHLPPVPGPRLTRIVASRSIVASLDASGFSLSDQFGPDRAAGMARRVSRWRAQGRRIILLPQAFGPFANGATAASVVRIVCDADLVFARDAESARHLESIGLGGRFLRSPDFTIGLAPASFELPRTMTTEFAAVVPNSKMLEKTSAEIARTYLDSLVHASRLAMSQGLQVVLVQHEATDGALIAEAQRELPEAIIFRDDDPRRLKFVLGEATTVIASRFHALVGGLSQGVPCVPLGWSHKYPQLFKDFGVEDLVPTEISGPAVGEVLRQIGEGRSTFQTTLRDSAARFARQNVDLWARVNHVIASGPRR